MQEAKAGGSQFEASMGYTVRSCLKKPKNKNKKAKNQ
jgi:hypothetical protein